MFGNADADVGVVLSHMGRPGDSQADWHTVAKELADGGVLALTYNRRGVCTSGSDRCSGGTDDLAVSWRDVVGASRLLERKGVDRVVLIGASIGAMASVRAAALPRLDVAGLVEIGGINHASGYEFTEGELGRIEGRKLFVSSRSDVYGGADSAREWYSWASPPKRLQLLPGDEHGTDMLRPGAPTKAALKRLLLGFAADVARRAR